MSKMKELSISLLICAVMSLIGLICVVLAYAIV